MTARHHIAAVALIAAISVVEATPVPHNTEVTVENAESLGFGVDRDDNVFEIAYPASVPGGYEAFGTAVYFFLEDGSYVVSRADYERPLTLPEAMVATKDVGNYKDSAFIVYYRCVERRCPQGGLVTFTIGSLEAFQ